MKLLEENIWDALQDISIGNDILDKTPKAQSIIAKIDKWNFIKLGSFCTAEETINRMK